MYSYDRRSAAYSGPVTTIEVDLPADNQQGIDSLTELLEQLKRMGDIGSSRSITIEDWDYRGDWDGDGPDRILDIRVQE